MLSRLKIRENRRGEDLLSIYLPCRVLLLHGVEHFVIMHLTTKTSSVVNHACKICVQLMADLTECIYQNISHLFYLMLKTVFQYKTVRVLALTHPCFQILLRTNNKAAKLPQMHLVSVDGFPQVAPLLVCFNYHQSFHGHGQPTALKKWICTKKFNSGVATGFTYMHVGIEPVLRYSRLSVQ